MLAVLQVMYFMEQEWMTIEDIEDTLKEKEFVLNRNTLNYFLREIIMMGSVKARLVDDVLEYKVRLVEDEN